MGKGEGLNPEIGEMDTSIRIQSGCDIFQGESKEIEGRAMLTDIH